jgi:hypothetical protein
MIHAYIRLMIPMCIPLQQSIMPSKFSNFQKVVDCKFKTSYFIFLGLLWILMKVLSFVFLNSGPYCKPQYSNFQTICKFMKPLPVLGRHK